MDTLVRNDCLLPLGITSGKLTLWLLWTLWKARNELIFNKKICSPEDLINRAVITPKEWVEEQNVPPRLPLS